MEESKQLAHMAELIQHTWLPIYRGQDVVGETRIGPRDSERIARNLINSGFIMQIESSWVYDEYKDCFVCCACGESTARISEDSGLASFCPNCGAKMFRGNVIDE